MKSIYILLPLFFPLFLFSQIKTDTIFSGKHFYVQLQESLTKDINNSVNVLEFCDDVEKVNSKYDHLIILDQGYPKAQVPFLLKLYNKKVKTNLFTDFDALIYSSYLNTGTFVTETYLFEFFFESEEKAKLCMNKIEELVKLRFEIEKLDKELTIGKYNWFYLQKNKRVYFIHSMSKNDTNCSVFSIIKNQIFDKIK
ncbi:hypothetical protein [Flavobacterium okayamense]|uniref:Uncharacterized protein n=1 Tax=Flavobacterium okayamense TaxID=2830782 RepID=A0ABM7S0Z1_9FLAO|nr:hypothetical protein [Flavobacterium okayamense]BCY27419.1 hypothetical protein KK2020170_02870 [Flavobacterium okayamense]